MSEAPERSAAASIPSNLEIAQAAALRPIAEVGAQLGLGEQDLELHGRYVAKLERARCAELARRLRPDGKLVLVTAMSPTPAGEGKTTTAVGLADALRARGLRTALCLREPSIGPCFGSKGGAAGGGYAQVVPMEEINLHFTGDFHAIGLANNLLSAVLDNHLHQGNALGLDPRRIAWTRVLDMNDRALRGVVVGLGGLQNSVPREEEFQITPASEVMACFCLAGDLADLRRRLGDVLVGRRRDGRPVFARELEVHGAMAALLRDAIRPNLVQTLEHTPTFVHGGPFGNIAHGANSIVATRAALQLADYVVTEAGFGSDLGAEKFVDIVCRKAGFAPAAAVVVATLRALKLHGGASLPELEREDPAALARGLANLERHVANVRRFGIPVVVALNRFTADSDAESAVALARCASLGVPAVESTVAERGSAGGEALARAVVELAAGPPAALRLLYEDELPLWGKVERVAREVYGARAVTAEPQVRAEFRRLEAEGWGRLPVCIAKTQYSFSADPKLVGAPRDFDLPVRGVRLAAGAGFAIVSCGDIMTMPGLPRAPAALRIDVDEDGRIHGLF